MTRSISLFIVACLASTEAFVVSPPSRKARTTTKLSANRRDFVLSGLVGAALAVMDPAEASFSAYTSREKDWETRMNKGEIKVSTARDLKRQLRKLVPQNSEASNLFCPNGPTAAVSPMMENRCSDQMVATPSVFGRTQDTVGNSIPGFEAQYRSDMPRDSTPLTANPMVGGFPKYHKKSERI